MNAAAYCADLVRERDPDRYFADLFAPEHLRPHLLALHAFNSEIARVPEIVSDPLPGEIRLQWWRDALRAGEPAGNPVAEALIATIEAFRLPVSAFESLLEARTFDLYNDPMPDRDRFEGYAGDTASALFRLAAIVLVGGRDMGSAEAAGHAGVAYALTGLLRVLPVHASRRQLFLPADVMAAHGVDLAAVFDGIETAGLRSALAELRSAARSHLRAALGAAGRLAPEIAPAFLPLALVEPYLRRMERADYRPLGRPVGLPLWRRQWILWRAARRGLKET